MSETAPVPRKGNPLFIVVVVILMAALAIEGYMLLRPKPKARPAAAQEAVAAGASQKVETFGDSEASIKIDFYAPLVLEWHQKTIGLLREYDAEHPGRISVRLMPMGQPECDAEIQARGVTCAIIYINGESNFTLPDGRKVELYQRPNQSTSTYNSEDVITVLDQMSDQAG